VQWYGSSRARGCRESECLDGVRGVLGREQAERMAAMAAERASAQGRCEVDGCNRPAFVNGLCGMHYKRVRKFGTIDDGPVHRVRSE
jgi:hypothetical protein